MGALVVFYFEMKGRFRWRMYVWVWTVRRVWVVGLLGCWGVGMHEMRWIVVLDSDIDIDSKEIQHALLKTLRY